MWSRVLIFGFKHIVDNETTANLIEIFGTFKCFFAFSILYIHI